MKEIPVFFTIDENYAPYLAVAINSIIKNASRDYQYRIIVLHQDVTDETVQKIRKLETDATSNFGAARSALTVRSRITFPTVCVPTISP